MITTTRVKPPAHLSKESGEWFSRIVVEYALESHHIKLLTLACEAWDRCCEARHAIEKNGLTYIDRFEQPRSRPEVAVERDSRLSFARLCRELCLDLSEPAEIRIPRRHDA